MKIVIDIPEEDYVFVKKQVADGITNPLKVCIANGTPLPKGKWIETYGSAWICSNCGAESWFNEDFKPKNDISYKYNYCHYCGAEMEADNEHL